MRLPVIDQTLGQYRLTEELGKGGFATVYRALQANLNRYVAIKVLHPEFIRDERALRRFKREALAIARLSHPNIVAVYDYGEHDGHVYLVMEYIAGNTLKGRLGKPVPYALALDVVHAVGSALDYAHAKGLIHRDVKPANILFTEDSRVLLSDFGIVRLADDDSDLTRGVIGTPQYMAPEQALGREVDGRSDLYSLGVVLYEMLTGRVPFRGDSPVATLSMHATQPVPPPRGHNPSLTEGIETVMQKALAKGPNDRYQSGRELDGALAAAIAEAERPPEPTVLVPLVGAPPSQPSAVAPQDLEAMYQKLLGLTRAQDWRAVVSLAAEILARDANFRDVSTILSSASNELRFGRGDTSVNLQMQSLMEEANGAIAGGRLMEAAAVLQQILRTAPNDPTARARLQEVNRRLSHQEAERRQQRRLEQLYDLAQSKIRSSDWQWAHHILQEMSTLDASYRDVPELLARAKAATGARAAEGSGPDATPASQIVKLRDEAEAAMAQERWADAVGLWEAVLAREPGLAGVAERLTTARHHATITSLNAEVARLAAEGKWDEAIQTLEEVKKITGP